MYCFSVECVVCIFSILQVFVLSVANALEHSKSSLEPVAINYDWVSRNIQTPGNNKHFMLARVTVTTKSGKCIYDKFIKPESRVIDCRTHFTGITTDMLKNGEDISIVKSYIQEIISEKIIVGHCLHRLLKYLILEHPVWDKRDIALYPVLQSYKTNIEPLKSMAHRLLNIIIHNGINSSVENAKASMKIYLAYKTRWDQHMLEKKESLTCPIAIDCEMVARAGRPGNNDMLARVSLVDINGTCIYDKYVLPTHTIVDYRTHVSGISKSKLLNAEPLEVVKREVYELTRRKVLVGHDLPKDTVLLGLHPPFVLKRDTSVFTRFRSFAFRRPKLKEITQKLLGITIQNGAHCSIEDAKACMELYKLYKPEWDREIYENELAYADQRDFTYSNPRYESPVVAIVCSLRPGSTRAERLHRVSIVDLNLVCIYDKFVSQSEEEDSELYNIVRHETELLLQQKVVVGFNLRSTFSALSTSATLINRRDALLFNKFKNPSKDITITELFNQFLPEFMGKNTTLNSVDEAKKLMTLYLKYRHEWDKHIYDEYSKQFETTYNSTLARPLAISILILDGANMSLLGRVSIIDTNENCIYDKYIRPASLGNIETWLDNDIYNQLKQGQPYEDAKREILGIINNKVLAGYCLNTTFRLLGIKKQWWQVRDASLFSRFQGFNQLTLPLSHILTQGLNMSLVNNYDTVKTARALLQLYKKFKDEWDEEIKRKRLDNKFSIIGNLSNS